MPSRPRTPVTLIALVLAVSVCGACASDREPDATGTPTTTSPAPVTSTVPSSRPTDRPSPTRGPSPTRPAESITAASPTQLTGLVRVVASIGDDGRGETLSGMVLTSDGTVVTNNHGVEGATAVEATVFSTGKVYGARVVATDPGHDVAVLKLAAATGLATVTPAERDAEVGDPVTVVGDARGAQSGFSAATGRVLALDQTLVTATTSTARAERLTGLVLSSSDVVSGDSGGPTYDARGRVVAMTTATIPRAGRIDGVGIPVSTVLSVVQNLLD